MIITRESDLTVYVLTLDLSKCLKDYEKNVKCFVEGKSEEGTLDKKALPHKQFAIDIATTIKRSWFYGAWMKTGIRNKVHDKETLEDIVRMFDRVDGGEDLEKALQVLAKWSSEDFVGFSPGVTFIRCKLVFFKGMRDLDFKAIGEAMKDAMEEAFKEKGVAIIKVKEKE